MSDFRIVCTRQEPGDASHGHIVQVGTGPTAQQYTQTWTVPEVYAAMDRGDRFLTFGEQSRQWALVEKFVCCGRQTLRSEADATTDNNLDSLPRCN